MRNHGLHGLIFVLLLSPATLFGQALSGPTSATPGSIPTYQDNKHLLNNPGLTFTNTIGLTVSNNVYVSSNLFVTNQLVPLQVGTSKLAGTDGSGVLTNIVVGTGLSLSGGTLSATGTTSSPTNTPIVLILGGTGGTNVSGGDWSSGSASGTTFKLILTTNVIMGTSTFSNVPNTNGQQNALLYIYQDGTGGYSVTWTNSGLFQFVNGIAPTQTTNANAVDVYSMFNSLATNGNMNVVQMNNMKGP